MSDTYLCVKSDGNVSRVSIPYESFNDNVHKLISCSIYELVHVPGDFYLVVDENGKIYEEPKPVNILASMLYPGTPKGDPIVGDVLIGRLGYVNGESDMVGLSVPELEMLEKYFDRIHNICFNAGDTGENN